MNSQVMMVLAVVLLIGAGVAGYQGLSQSRQPPTTVAAPAPQSAAEPVVKVVERLVEKPGVKVVTLARDVPANTTLTVADLAVETLSVAPPGSFSETAPLVGRPLWRALPAGSVLDEHSFDVGGPLARMIRDGERALAVNIDEVVAAGGYVRPGDYVDVLLFLREDNRNGDRSVQVAVPALRVLAVGSTLGLDLAGRPVSPPVEDDDNKKSSGRAAAARTAVLAVPETLLTRFALAAEVGSLRMAVRSAEEGLLADFYSDNPQRTDTINRQLYQFERFAVRETERRPPGIPVMRGGVVSRETP